MNKIVVISLMILLGLSSISAHGDSFIDGINPDSQIDPSYVPKHFSTILREEMGVSENDGEKNDIPRPSLYRVILEEKIGL